MKYKIFFLMIFFSIPIFGEVKLLKMPSVEEKIKNFNSLAQDAIKEDDPSRAINYFQRIIELKNAPKIEIANAYYMIGSLYYNHGLYQKSIFYYEKAIENGIFIQKKEIYENLLKTYFFYTKQFDLAKKCFAELSIYKDFMDLESSKYIKNKLFTKVINLKKFIESGEPNISSIYLNDKNEILVGTWDGSLYDYSLKNNKFKILKKGYIDVIARPINKIKPNGGKIWYSYPNLVSGINSMGNESKIETPKKEYFHFIEDFLWVDDNNLLVATSKGGLWRYSVDSSYWYKVKGMPTEGFLSIKKYGDEIYLGTMYNGILVLDSSKLSLKKEIKPYENYSSVTSDVIVYDNKIWATTFGNGIYIFDKEGNVLENLTQSNSILREDYLKNISQDEKFIYVTSVEKGLFIYSKIKKKWVSEPIDISLGFNNINAFVVNDDNLLLGSLGSGILILDKKGLELDF